MSDEHLKIERVETMDGRAVPFTVESNSVIVVNKADFLPEDPSFNGCISCE